MLHSGPARRVTIYLGESQRYHGHSAYMALLEFLFHHQVAGATVTRGIAGFGSSRHLHTTEVLTASENLPIKIEFVESEAKLDELLPKLRDMAAGGLVTVQPLEVVLAPTAAPEPAPAPLPHRKLEGAAKLMRVYIGEADRWNGKPLHTALLDLMRAHDLAGATVYRGLTGYGAGQAPDHDRPIMISVVDTEAKIRAFLPLLESMISGGLVAISDVDVIKYVHGPAPAREGA